MQDWLPSVTALVAVVVGLLVTIWVTNCQIRANVVSVSRHAWINTLRDELAEYHSALLAGPLTVTASVSEADVMGNLQRIQRLASKIEMLLNPSESDHLRLIDVMHKLREQMLPCTTGFPPEGVDFAEASRLSAVFLDVARPILKREWERVKTGN